jgi:hypothetical protein
MEKRDAQKDLRLIETCLSLPDDGDNGITVILLAQKHWIERAVKAEAQVDAMQKAIDAAKILTNLVADNGTNEMFNANLSLAKALLEYEELGKCQDGSGNCGCLSQKENINE